MAFGTAGSWDKFKKRLRLAMQGASSKLDDLKSLYAVTQEIEKKGQSHLYLFHTSVTDRGFAARVYMVLGSTI